MPAILSRPLNNPTQRKNPFKARKNLKTHPKAVIGSTAERKAAWERLTPEQQAKVLEKFRTIIEDAKAKAIKERRQQKREVVETVFAFTDKQGNRQLLKGKEWEASRTAVESQNIEPLRCFDCEPDPCLTNPLLCEPDPTPTPTPYSNTESDSYAFTVAYRSRY